MNCATCLALILWETFASMRVYRDGERGRVYRSRCNCGTVYRDVRGNPMKGPR